MTKETIAIIKKNLTTITEPTDPKLNAYRQDRRKGVQQAVTSWERAYQKKQRAAQQAKTMVYYENEARAKGFQVIAGIDEVGRGPLAGPVVAAAVIFPNNYTNSRINDSKQLTVQQRNELFECIQTDALAIGLGVISEGIIDKVNIYEATKLAMVEAIKQLTLSPDYLLIDAMKLPQVELAQESLIKGDAKSVSIAAASIIAKVTRDKMMSNYGQEYPAYGFETNMGYGTKQHLEALAEFGPTAIHRKTFAPVKNYK